MNVHPNEWLLANAYGYRELSEVERQAIMYFSLLWGLFEDKALNNDASPARIRSMVERWEHEGRLNRDAFAGSLDYFANRYFKNQSATLQFEGLRFRSNDLRQFVEAVLKRENTNPMDEIIALLNIVYRLRNNLFHGVKWVDGIRDQLDNFTHANTVLMTAIDLS